MVIIPFFDDTMTATSPRAAVSYELEIVLPSVAAMLARVESHAGANMAGKTCSAGSSERFAHVQGVGTVCGGREAVAAGASESSVVRSALTPITNTPPPRQRSYYTPSASYHRSRRSLPQKQRRRRRPRQPVVETIQFLTPPDNHRVLVSNLPNSTTVGDVRALFDARCGAVHSVVLYGCEGGQDGSSGGSSSGDAEGDMPRAAKRRRRASGYALVLFYSKFSTNLAISMSPPYLHGASLLCSGLQRRFSPCSLAQIGP